MKTSSCVAVLALLLAGCAEERRAPERSATALRFVRPPVVTFTHFRPHPSTNVGFTTTVRLNRALRQNRRGVQADIEVSGATGTLVGMWRPVGVRRCYVQENDLVEGVAAPRDGQIVTVRLTVKRPRRQVLTARVRAHRTGAEHASQQLRGVVRRLGCPAAPPTRTCNEVVGTGTGDIAVSRVGGGAACATGVRVMRAVGRWADDRNDHYDLGARRHRLNAGFRCTVAKTGEIDWTITCRRGRQVVYGYTGG